ncbi:hypothetical protein JOB18_000225 [Solea senegalensis]|uniref:Uncharacterized protein n=1 Tax=Solea senegalensis TaxID=28829 RepID=A0AAV6PZY8_SOLSE|nr:hypothetical protein JOB18_000225 [Solea senegalensis]
MASVSLCAETVSAHKTGANHNARFILKHFRSFNLIICGNQQRILQRVFSSWILAHILLPQPWNRRLMTMQWQRE